MTSSRFFAFALILSLFGCSNAQRSAPLADDDEETDAGGNESADAGPTGSDMDAARDDHEDAGTADAGPVQFTVRFGHYNIKELSTDKLVNEDDDQVNSAVQVIARFSPDIIDINEIQYDIRNTPTRGLPGAPSSSTYGDFGDEAQNGQRLADRVAAADPSVTYTETMMFLGNSGFYWEHDDLNSYSYVLRGWGEWKGRFATAVLSRYPILHDQVRVIADFAWEDMPGNLISRMHDEIGLDVPSGFPLFEKSLNIVPIEIHGQVIYLVLLHPTASPAELDQINPYRNHDELVALNLFINGELPGVEALPDDAKFIISGDLNADPDPEDGDGLSGPIQDLLANPRITVHFAHGAGTRGRHGEYNTYLGGCGNDDGETVANPRTHMQMQLDYQLPSIALGAPVDNGVFFPNFEYARHDFDLACHASDHRFVWADYAL